MMAATKRWTAGWLRCLCLVLVLGAVLLAAAPLPVRAAVTINLASLDTTP